MLPGLTCGYGASKRQRTGSRRRFRRAHPPGMRSVGFSTCRSRRSIEGVPAIGGRRLIVQKGSESTVSAYGRSGRSIERVGACIQGPLGSLRIAGRYSALLCARAVIFFLGLEPKIETCAQVQDLGLAADCDSGCLKLDAWAETDQGNGFGMLKWLRPMAAGKARPGELLYGLPVG